MSNSQVNVVPIQCRLSNLIVSPTDGDPTASETILQEDQPFSLKVTVEFLGSGAIALLSLSPSILVEFYTKLLSPEAGVVLGQVGVKTTPGILVYFPTLTLAPPLAIGLQIKTLYCIGAVLRVGAPNGPSLINGFIEEPIIEIYSPPALDEKQPRKRNSRTDSQSGPP
jgi:hypothetical protein